MKDGTIKTRSMVSKKESSRPNCNKTLLAGSSPPTSTSRRSSIKGIIPPCCPYGLATCPGCTEPRSPHKRSIHESLFHNGVYSSHRHNSRSTSDLKELAKLAHKTSFLLAETDVVLESSIDKPKVIQVDLIGTLQGLINSLQRWQLRCYSARPYVLPYETENLSALNVPEPEVALAKQSHLHDTVRKYASPDIALQHVFLELLLLLLRGAAYDIASEVSDQLLHESLIDGEAQMAFFIRSAEQSAEGLYQSIPHLRQLEVRGELIPTGCVRLLVCMSLSLAMRWYARTNNVKGVTRCADTISEIPDGHLYASSMADTRASACESLANWIETAW